MVNRLVGSVSLFVIGGVFMALFFHTFSRFICWNTTYIGLSGPNCSYGFLSLVLGIGLIIAGVVIAVKAKN